MKTTTKIKSPAKKTKRKPAIRELSLHDQRMIQVIEAVVSNEGFGVKSKSAFLEMIGFPKFNFYQVRHGLQSFQPDNMSLACDLFGVDGRFFLQKNHVTMFEKEAKLTPIQFLKQAVSMVEMEMKGK